MGEKTHYIDKEALLHEGKLFCRVFLSYLWCNPLYKGWEGKESLANDLLEVGKKKCRVTRAYLTHNDLTALLYKRTAKNPYWLNFSLMDVALRNGFIPEHMADWIAIYKTVSKDKDLSSKIEIDDELKSEYGLTIPENIKVEMESYIVKRSTPSK